MSPLWQGEAWARVCSREKQTWTSELVMSGSHESKSCSGITQGRPPLWPLNKERLETETFYCGLFLRDVTWHRKPQRCTSSLYHSFLCHSSACHFPQNTIIQLHQRSTLCSACVCVCMGDLRVLVCVFMCVFECFPSELPKTRQHPPCFW